MALRRKAMAGITAVSLAALIATGTFAWTSLNSQRVNEWRGSGNSQNNIGGTLHNDHQDNDSSHSVYVENWGEENIFARVMLREYMETGTGAGLTSLGKDPVTGDFIPNPENLAESLVSGADIDHPATWRTYDPDRPVTDGDIGSYWSWDMGGRKYYYPAPAGSRVNKDYIDSGSPSDLTADSVNAQGVSAKQTRLAEVMTMAQWKADGSQTGDYWVIDTDGWAYWAAPIAPGEATGLLLSKVTQLKTPVFDYYYGINVVADMATKDGSVNDNGQEDNYYRFGDAQSGGWTADGQALMEKIVNNGSPVVPDNNENSYTLTFPGVEGVTLSYYVNGAWTAVPGTFSYSGTFNAPSGVTSVRADKGGMGYQIDGVNNAQQKAFDIPINFITVTEVTSGCALSIVQDDWVYSSVPAVAGERNVFIVFDNGKPYEVRVNRTGFYTAVMSDVAAGDTVSPVSIYQVTVPEGVTLVRMQSNDWIVNPANAGDVITLLMDVNNIQDAHMSYVYNGVTHNVDFKLDGTDPFSGLIG